MNDCDVTPIGAAAEPYPEALFFLNRQGSFTFLNEHFSELTGYAPAALQGRPLAELIEPDAAAAVLPILHRVLRGEMLSFDVPLLTAAGRYAAFAVSTFPQ